MTTTANPDELLEAASAFVSAMGSFSFDAEDIVLPDVAGPYLRLKVAVASAKFSQGGRRARDHD